jgi:hypothetical protein
MTRCTKVLAIFQLPRNLNLDIIHYMLQFKVSWRYNFFLILDCEAIGTAAAPGLLCQPRVIEKMIVEKQMECRLAGEKPKFSEKTCPSATLVHHKIPHDQTRV